MRAGQRTRAPFSVVVLATQPGILSAERRKLAQWGELVLRNHAPPGSAVALDPAGSSCLLLVPDMDEAAAWEIAQCFAEQLNKLPVFGVAPGEGWTWDYATFPNHSEGLLALRHNLAAELGRAR
jgi:hypothetical protein